MRAVVTGGAGFIGSHLVDRLLEANWIVDVIDRATGPSIIETPTPNADVIFHLAAPVGPVGVLGWAGRLVPEVVTTSQIVAWWAMENDCPLVNVSTSEVYGSGGEDREDGPCTFQAADSARKEYALAKLAAESMLHNMAGLNVRTVRPFNVAGPRQKPDGGFVLPRFIAQARAEKPLTVYTPGTQRRAFTHVADIVDGVLAALSEGGRGQVYNLGNPANACTIAQLADEVIEQVGSGWVQLIDPTTIHGPAFREAPDKLPNADRARIELGWEPRYDRAAIIAACLAG